MDPDHYYDHLGGGGACFAALEKEERISDRAVGDAVTATVPWGHDRIIN